MKQSAIEGIVGSVEIYNGIGRFESNILLDLRVEDGMHIVSSGSDLIDLQRMNPVLFQLYLTRNRHGRVSKMHVSPAIVRILEVSCILKDGIRTCNTSGYRERNVCKCFYLLTEVII